MLKESFLLFILSSTEMFTFFFLMLVYAEREKMKAHVTRGGERER